MLEFAQEQNAKTITAWLEESIDFSKNEKDLSGNPLPDLWNLVPEDYEGLPADIFAVRCDTPDILRTPDFREQLLKGGMPFWFAGVSGKSSPRMKAKIKALINMSDFEDETKENGVPHIDCDDPSDMAKYTFIMSKNAKLTPIKDVDLVNIGIMTDPEYHEYLNMHKAERTKIYRIGEDGWIPRNGRTIRSTQKLFAGLTTTVQIQISELDVNEINQNPHLSDGVKWTKAFLTERTKQDINQTDSTAKIKALALVKQTEHGVLLLVTSITANTLVPAWAVNAAKGKAIAKLVDTAKGSREYYLTKFPDGRKPEGYKPRIPIA